MKPNLERVYHPYWNWEEIDHNMWGSVEDTATYLRRVLKLTSDHRRYGRFMERVIHEWPVSCENALTDKNLNRKAWVGHAACALALACPEDIVRKAWGMLTDEQRTLANGEADRAIQAWENAYRQSIDLRGVLAGTLLPAGHTSGGTCKSHEVQTGTLIQSNRHSAAKK